MQIGVSGLGRIGGNIARRLIPNGHEPAAYDHDAKAIAAVSRAGATGAAGSRSASRPRRPSLAANRVSVPA